jgi:hypothetical protein
MSNAPPPPPPGVCINCYRSWLTTQPRPKAVYCWHHKVLAKQRGDSWRVLRHVKAANVARMRRERLPEPVVPSTLGYWLEVSNRQRHNPAAVLLDLTDAELATAATACRAMAYQEGERAKQGAYPTLRGPLEQNAKRYAELARKLEAARGRTHSGS